jgi:hypothetical protein
MKRGPGNKLSLCLHAAIIITAAMLAACGGSSSAPVPQPQSTAGTAVIYPLNPSVPVGGVIEFLANQPGQSGTAFKWTVKGSGTIDTNTGVYTAGATPATATITATAGNFTGSTTVNVTAAPINGITMTPAALFVKAGSTTPIAATIGGVVAAVTEWDVNSTQGGDTLHGTIDNLGNYTAPLTPPPGGNTTITAKTATAAGNATVTVVFSKASLNGPYAFSYTGADSKGFLDVAGSFTADGLGGITNLVEDVAASDIAPMTSSVETGTFIVAPDGSAQATLTNGTSTATWQFELAGNLPADAGRPAQKALLVRFDKTGTGSGTIEQQDSSAVNSPLPLGPYTFLISQRNSLSKMFAAAGKFESTGLLGNTGALTPGVWDVNNGGTVLSDDTTLHGSFATDTSRPNTGRGTLVLTTTNVVGGHSTLNFAFYVVDATHLKLVETDGAIFSSGDIFNAPNTNGSFSTASLAKGSYAFTTAGASNPGPYAQGGVFASNGSGSITAGEMDVNNAGTASLAGILTQTSYTVDPALGRISFTITDTLSSKTVGTWSYAGYQTSSGSMAIVETDSLNIVSVVSGMAYRQASTSALQGGYASDFTGASGSTEEDVAGEFVVNNTSISTGSLNSNVSGNTLAGAPVTIALVVAPDTGGRGTATIATNAESFPIAYYQIDANNSLLLETDATRVITGTLARQY